MTLEELITKLEENHHELVEEGNESCEYFVNHAYEYAHYNEVLDFFEQMDEEDYKERWEEQVSACEFEEDDNILFMIYNQWLDYNHPEYHNFFCYEGLIEILEYFFKAHRRAD